MKINRITLAGDFLRPGGDVAISEEMTASWLNSYIWPLLRALAPRARICTLEAGSPKNSDVLRSQYYGICSLEQTAENWARLYDGEPNLRQLALLAAYFRNSLVVGAGLPPAVTRGLDKLGLPWIDIVIHPARFLHDLACGIRSNIQGMAEIAADWLLRDEVIKIGAAFAAGRFARMQRLDECCADLDIGVFVCQNKLDADLISNGKIESIRAHADGIRQIMRRHDRILVLSPQKENESALFLTHLLPNARSSGGDFYHILGHENVTAVYSLASGRTQEAFWLGKGGAHLGEYRPRFSASGGCVNEFMPISDGAHQPLLWRRILKLLGFACIDLAPDFRIPFNLRESLAS